MGRSRARTALDEDQSWTTDSMRFLLIAIKSARSLSSRTTLVRLTNIRTSSLLDGRDAIAHRRNQEVAHVHAVYRSNANPNPSAIGQGVPLHCRRQLAFPAKEFLALAQLLILVLAHFLPALFQHARHAMYLPGSGSLEAFCSKCKSAVALPSDTAFRPEMCKSVP